MRLGLIGAVVLAGCAAEAPPPEAPGWRDRTVPIGASLRGGPQDLAEDWIVSAGYPVPAGLWDGTAARGATVAAPFIGDRVRIGPGAIEIAGHGGTGRWALVPDGPGTYRAGEGRLWLLWADDDFRTAVIGSGDGRLGWVMDRPGQASADRAAAAREILEFNGYDLSALVRVPPVD